METEPRIYVDHAATTPTDKRVVSAMLPYLTDLWGNPSSIYAEAREARKGLDAAHRAVAEALGARPQEVIFTSGGSESDNLALRGVAYGARRRGNHIITTAVEHHAVLHTAERLEQEGFRVTYLPVDREGFVDLAALEEALDDETTLVSVMYANNEVGTIQPIAEVVRIVKARDPHIAVHTDAVQAAGYLDLNVDRLGVDLLSLAAHKIYGPKGAGVLYVRSRTPLVAQTLGGAQEKNRRAGTENVAGAAGMAAALRLAEDERAARAAHARALRDRLLAGLPRRVPGTRLTGPADLERRLPNSLSCCFEGVEGESVLLQLDLKGVSASSGSACTTGSLEPSHVLLAMRVPHDLARGSLRITLGKDNTMAEIDRLLELIPESVERLRSLAPRASRPTPAG
ncbi:MAG: cysteine desulfurase [Chloroflexi bacterium]|nr:cysteine desulfurase [Chloroflexota bacterium]